MLALLLLLLMSGFEGRGALKILCALHATAHGRVITGRVAYECPNVSAQPSSRAQSRRKSSESFGERKDCYLH